MVFQLLYLVAVRMFDALLRAVRSDKVVLAELLALRHEGRCCAGRFGAGRGCPGRAGRSCPRCPAFCPALSVSIGS